MEQNEQELKAKAYLDKNTKKLTEQVEETYKFAFFNLLEERVNAIPPDCDWLTRLYGEIRLKLTQLLKTVHILKKRLKNQWTWNFSTK